MLLKKFQKVIRKSINFLERIIYSRFYFSLHEALSYADKIHLLRKYILWKFIGSKEYPDSSAINFILYSKACERMLMPLILNLLKRVNLGKISVKVNLIVLQGIHQLKLNSFNSQQLKRLNCEIQTDYFCLIRACQNPSNNIAFVCLDHRTIYQHHKWGVDTVDTLKKFGVKTFSIQHGGTRTDSIESLASSASDILLVWGQRVFRELVDKYSIDPNRLKIIGNPLHDQFAQLDDKLIVKTLIKLYPRIQEQLRHKKIILLATCLHSEYKGYENEDEMYKEYIRHIYESLDFFKYILLIKMHPLDTRMPNIYLDEIPELDYIKNSIVVIDSTTVSLDVYSLLKISDLLITRASTVAEEALLIGKKSDRFRFDS